jgi:two-component system response regulator
LVVQAVLNHEFVVLIAEDDPNDLELLRLATYREGVRAVRFKHVIDGQEAIDYLEGRGEYTDRHQNPFPDLVVLDLKMPRIDGLEVLDWLRGHPICQRLPVVMLSGSGLEKDVESAYRLGVKTYFAKPGSLDGYKTLARIMIDYWRQSQRPRVHDCAQA